MQLSDSSIACCLVNCTNRVARQISSKAYSQIYIRDMNVSALLYELTAPAAVFSWILCIILFTTSSADEPIKSGLAFTVHPSNSQF